MRSYPPHCLGGIQQMASDWWAELTHCLNPAMFLASVIAALVAGVLPQAPENPEQNRRPHLRTAQPHRAHSAQR